MVRGALLCNLALDLLALVCAISARAACGVGMKDERPLWEKVHKF